MKRFAAAVLAFLLAVACGGGDEPGPVATASAESSGTRSIAELVAALDGVGCPLEEVTPTEGFDIYRQASCPDAEVQVYTFTSRAARDDVVDGILGIEGEFAVVGPNWVAEVRSRTMADAVQRKIGGVVRASEG